MSKQLIGIEIKRLQLKALKETPGNPQKMDEKTFSGIIESMKNKGWLLDAPVIWEKSENDYQIISGHHRVQAGIKAGILDTDCKVLKGITEEQAKILVLEANQRKGEFDDIILNDFIEDIINNYDYDIDDIINEAGFDDYILNNKGKKIIKNEDIRSYKKTHILISFSPDKFIDIKDFLENISLIEGVEIEQGSN